MSAPNREAMVELFKGSQVISSQMPVKFGNGYSWEEFHGLCGSCNCQIPDGLFRGLVTRPLPSVAAMEAVGFCQACNLLTPFCYRLHQDGRLSGILGGRWREWQAKASPWRRALRLLFGSLVPG